MHSNFHILLLTSGSLPRRRLVIFAVISSTDGLPLPSDEQKFGRTEEGGFTNTLTYLASGTPQTGTNSGIFRGISGYTSNRVLTSNTGSTTGSVQIGQPNSRSYAELTSFENYTSFENTGYTAFASFSISIDTIYAPFNTTSSSSSFSTTVSPNTCEITTTQSYSFDYEILTTSSNSPFFSVWTSVASNTAGTQITQTNVTRRGSTFSASTSTGTRVTISTATCDRRVRTTCIHFATNEYSEQQQDFLIKKASNLSFNSNQFYHLTDCADVSTAATSSAYEANFSTFQLYLVGSRVSGGLTDAEPFPNPPNNTFPLTDEAGQQFTVSYHPSGRLITSIYTIADVYSTFTISDFNAFRDTADQIKEILYDGSTTSQNTDFTNATGGTRTIRTTAALSTAKTQICVTSFFGKGTRTLTGPFLQTILTKTSVSLPFQNADGLNFSQSTSSSFDGQGFGTSTGFFTQSGSGEIIQYTNLRGSSVVQAPPYDESGFGAGVHVIYTDSNFIDFLLQEPFNKGTSFPVFKELTGGYLSAGLIGGYYNNPQNFFNLEDDLVANIPDYEQYFGGIGGNSHKVEGCLVLNENDEDSFEPQVRCLASCPITMNTTDSFVLSGGQTTQFITYSFSSGNSYSITTLNSVSATSASITSGTTTHRWQGQSPASTGYRDNYNGLYFKVNNYVSPNGMTFSPHAGAAYLFTDYSFNSGNFLLDSTTGIVKGFFGTDLSPSSAFPYSVTRSVGKRVDADINFDISPELIPCPAIYVKKVPSFLGFNSSFFSERIQGGVFAGIANTYADPSF